MNGSSDAQAQGDIRRSISDAVEDASDGPLDPERLQSIRQLLLNNRDARRYYLQVNELNHYLANRSVLPADSDIAAPNANAEGRRERPRAPQPPFFSKRVLLGAVAALSIAVVVAALFRSREQAIPRSRVIASLEQVNGDVIVATTDAETRWVSGQTEITSGDTVQTMGTLSSAVLLFPDGTRLLLVGESSLTVSDFGQKSVVFHAGTMFASVAPQRVDRPMLVTTPKDKLQVLGTRFSLDATARRTDLSVSQGRVKITRLRDGKSVEVPAGQRVVSDSLSELALQEIPTAPDSWSVDFENGLPDGWESGALVADGLPDGSRFAVKAVMVGDGDDKSRAIVSQPEWLRGAFSVHPDSHLQITFKMAHPNWVNVFLLTRTRQSAEPHFANNFQYNEIPAGRLQPDRWYSMTVPLSDFERLPGYTDEPLQELLPFQIVFSAPGADRGLVVDRIAIGRGGPGMVELKRVD